MNPLEVINEVYDAELLRAQKALEMAISEAGVNLIKVFLDNCSVVRAFNSGRAKSS